MTYNVFSGTLNLTQSISLQSVSPCPYLVKFYLIRFMFAVVIARGLWVSLYSEHIAHKQIADGPKVPLHVTTNVFRTALRSGAGLKPWSHMRYDYDTRAIRLRGRCDLRSEAISVITADYLMVEVEQSVRYGSGHTNTRFA